MNFFVSLHNCRYIGNFATKYQLEVSVEDNKHFAHYGHIMYFVIGLFRVRVKAKKDCFESSTLRKSIIFTKA